MIEAALERRRPWLDRWHSEQTTCYRLFHGAVEGRAGTTVDRYGPLLLVQTWREPLVEGDLARIREACAGVGLELPVVWNERGPRAGPGGILGDLPRDPRGDELGLSYDVRPRHRGSDPLLFLDLRAGRRRIRAEAAGRSVLNLFAYTGGSGLAALAGGAEVVWNVDFAGSALEIAATNALHNKLDARLENIREDVYPVTRQLAGLGVHARRPRPYRRVERRAFDLVVLDPPTWATSPWGAIDLVRDYAGVFKPALLACKEGGAMLVTNHVSTVTAEEWHAALRRTASKAGREIRSLEPILPEEDFPSLDGRPPLKIAWLAV